MSWASFWNDLALVSTVAVSFGLVYFLTILLASVLGRPKIVVAGCRSSTAKKYIKDRMTAECCDQYRFWVQNFETTPVPVSDGEVEFVFSTGDTGVLRGDVFAYVPPKMFGEDSSHIVSSGNEYVLKAGCIRPLKTLVFEVLVDAGTSVSLEVRMPIARSALLQRVLSFIDQQSADHRSGGNGMAVRIRPTRSEISSSSSMDTYSSWLPFALGSILSVFTYFIFVWLARQDALSWRWDYDLPIISLLVIVQAVLVMENRHHFGIAQGYLDLTRLPIVE